MTEPRFGTCDEFSRPHQEEATCVNWTPVVIEVDALGVCPSQKISDPCFDSAPVALEDNAWRWWFGKTARERKELIITFYRREQELKYEMELMKSKLQIMSEGKL